MKQWYAQSLNSRVFGAAKRLRSIESHRNPENQQSYRRVTWNFQGNVPFPVGIRFSTGFFHWNVHSLRNSGQVKTTLCSATVSTTGVHKCACRMEEYTCPNKGRDAFRLNRGQSSVNRLTMLIMMGLSKRHNGITRNESVGRNVERNRERKMRKSTG